MQSTGHSDAYFHIGMILDATEQSGVLKSMSSVKWRKCSKVLEWGIKSLNYFLLCAYYHLCIFSMFSYFQNSTSQCQHPKCSEVLHNMSSKCHQFRMKMHCILPYGHSGPKHRGAGSGRPANKLFSIISLLSNGWYGTSNYCTLLFSVKEPLLYRSTPRARGFFTSSLFYFW